MMNNKYWIAIVFFFMSLNTLQAQQSSDVEILDVEVLDTVSLGCDMPINVRMVNHGPNPFISEEFGVSFNVGAEGAPMDLTTTTQEFFAKTPPIFFEVGDTFSVQLNLPIRSTYVDSGDDIEATTKNVIIVWASPVIPDDNLDNNYALREINVTEGEAPEETLPPISNDEEIELQEQELEEDEIPQAILDYLEDHYDEDEIDDIDEVELEYEYGSWIIALEVDDDELVFALDGTFLLEEEEFENIDDLPSDIEDFFDDNTQYDFEEAELAWVNGVLVYAVEIDDDEYLFFDEDDGNFLGQNDFEIEYEAEDLDDDIQSFVDDNYGDAVSEIIVNEESNTPYEVILDDGTSAFFDASNNFVYQSGESLLYPVDEENVPANVLAYIDSNYPNEAPIAFYLRNDLNCNLSYIAEFSEEAAIFDTDGNFVTADNDFEGVNEDETDGENNLVGIKKLALEWNMNVSTLLDLDLSGYFGGSLDDGRGGKMGDDITPIIKCAPNPANDIVYLQGIGNQAIKKLILVNIYGQTVWETTMPTTSIHTSDFSNGVYFLIIQDTQKTYLQKIEILH